MSELPSGWIQSKISDAIFLNEKHVGISDDTECGFVPMALVPTGYGEPVKYETRTWDKCKKGFTQFKDNDVILAKITPCFENGKGALVTGLPNGIGAGSTEYFVLRTVRNLVEPKYIHAFVKTKEFLFNCETNMSGSVGHRRVPKDYLLNYPLPLAPLNEQKRIVEKLDEVLAQVDTIKARLDGIPAILKRFRQSVLAAAVSGKLIDLNETKITTIGEVSEDIRYGTSKKCDYKGGSTPVIRIPNIGDRKLDTSDLKLADFTERELEKLALKTGDLLVIRSNGSLELVAKPALVEPQYEGFLYAGYLIRIRCDREKILPSFLLNVLSSRVVRDVVELGARSTSGVNNINSKELSALEFVLPSISEQKEIVRLVDQYFAFAETIEAQVKKAQTRVDNLTQSILAKAFRGELVEQDPNDEPADKLLERIAAARKEAEALAKAAKKAQTAKKRTVKKESAQES